MTKGQPPAAPHRAAGLQDASPSSVDIEVLFQRAAALHQQGKLRDAEILYRSVLTQSPAHFDALRLLGVIYYQSGQPSVAAELIGRAICLNPHFAPAHSNYGLALQELKRPAEALASYERALQLMPDFAEAHINRGNALLELMHPAEALTSFERALRLVPDYTEAHINRGNALLELGRLDDALVSYENALRLQPDYPQAHYNRGNVLLKLNRPEEALAGYERALLIKPDYSEAHLHRGNALLDLKRSAEALAGYERALQLKPDDPDALNVRGNALCALNRPNQALANYDRALELNSDYAEAHSNRGKALLDLERFDDAIVSFERALQLKPDYPQALYNRGNALAKLKRPADALAGYDYALRIKPYYAEAWSNRGNALLDLKRPDEALASFEQALRFKPNDAEAYGNHGNALLELRRYDEALASYDRAWLLNHSHPETLYNRGNALLELKRPGEALADYTRALQLKPDYADALYNYGNALSELGRYGEAAKAFAQLLGHTPAYDYALGQMFHAWLRHCDWSNYDATRDQIVLGIEGGERTSLPFGLLAHSRQPATQLHCARIYVADKHPASSKSLWAGLPYRHDRIRIAYLSADFHGHATAYLTAALFETHDRARFEVSAFSFGPDGRGEIRDRLERSFDAFTDVRRMSDGEVAQLLREREIDIAVDLKGFTENCRTGIFACRAAPLQVGYLGFPGTMGADYIDYIIADPHVIPPGHEPFYSEKIVRLPDTYQVNDRKRRIAERTPSGTELGLPTHGFVFCCFNNNWKITPHIFDIWMRLLKRVEDSVLWLLEDNEEASRNLKREAEKRGVPAKRLVFAPRMDLASHLARHRQADLFLDTVPCNAHTTASDALWAGLPVVTCMGESFASRVAGSLLYAAGLPELVTQRLEDYEALALELATAPNILADIKAKLVRNRDTCTLFDTDRFRRHIEAAYITMYERQQHGEPPSDFDISPIESCGHRTAGSS